MVQIHVSLKGDKQLLRALNKLKGSHLRTVARDAVRAGLSIWSKRAKVLCPQRTGQLRKSLGVVMHRTKPSAGAITGSVRPRRGFSSEYQGKRIEPRKYAHLVENGTQFAPAHPFLKPAFEGSRFGVERQTKQRLWRGIERIAARAS